MPRGASCVFLLHSDEYFHVAQVRAFNGVSTAKMPSIQYQYNHQNLKRRLFSTFWNHKYGEES